jgi:hypothetical protein
LARIAKRQLGSSERSGEIVALNPGLVPNRLRVGQEIQLPPVGAPPAGAWPTGTGPTGTGPEGTPPAGAPPAGAADLLLQQIADAPSAGRPPISEPASGSVAALADLTSRYLDLQAELEVQGATAEETAKMAEQGLLPQREALRAAVTLRALERKLVICEQLIDGEISATESELAWYERRREECSPTEALQLDVLRRRAETRLRALQAVK